MKEVWKDIPGFNGRYQISNYGNAKSIPRWAENRHNGYLMQKPIIDMY